MNKIIRLFRYLFPVLALVLVSANATPSGAFTVPERMMSDEYITKYGVPFEQGTWFLDNRYWFFNPPRNKDGSIDYALISIRDIYMIWELPADTVPIDNNLDENFSDHSKLNELKIWQGSDIKNPKKHKKNKHKHKKKKRVDLVI